MIAENVEAALEGECGRSWELLEDEGEKAEEEVNNALRMTLVGVTSGEPRSDIP